MTLLTDNNSNGHAWSFPEADGRAAIKDYPTFYEIQCNYPLQKRPPPPPVDLTLSVVSFENSQLATHFLRTQPNATLLSTSRFRKWSLLLSGFRIIILCLSSLTDVIQHKETTRRTEQHLTAVTTLRELLLQVWRRHDSQTLLCLLYGVPEGLLRRDKRVLLCWACRRRS
jgi:hypothetical protein